ncbi:MAG: mechanosensitive ion channel family protein, partial [Pusillimonas sp.]|nr:mechanosensitive ion channel family protein [Pusillimonas sp.]
MAGIFAWRQRSMFFHFLATHVLRQRVMLIVLLVLSLGGLGGISASSVASTKSVITESPLAPPDTSSPRAVYQGLVGAIEDAYALAKAGRSSEEAMVPLLRATRALDLSEVPADLRASVGIEAALLIKEVLDRIPKPSLRDIPDTDMVRQNERDLSLAKLLGQLRAGVGEDGLEAVRRSQSQPIDQWTVPGTEMQIVKIKEGSNAGQFRFSAETVARVHAYYDRVKNLPYIETNTPNIFDAYILTPGIGLDLSWESNLPEWVEGRYLDQTYWQWGLLLLTLVALLIVTHLLLKLGRLVDTKINSDTSMDQNGAPVYWRPGTFLALLVTIFATASADWFTDDWINITGLVLLATKDILLFYKFALIAWAATLALTQGANLVAKLRRMSPHAPSMQLLRLGSRLAAFIMVPGLMVYAAHKAGIPAYSVITGLGIGGLAVALAARETLANLLGSMMIMFDRPYQIGDYIRLGDDAGTVEDIGFRSTRIRTFHDSVLSLPNANCVSMPVDNLGRRVYRRVSTTIGIRYDTPPERIEAFVEGIKEIVLANPYTRKDFFHVYLNDFGSSTLNILFYIFLRVPDWSTELAERERLLLEVIRL